MARAYELDVSLAVPLRRALDEATAISTANAHR